jgi:hypothetical protein
LKVFPSLFLLSIFNIKALWHNFPCPLQFIIHLGWSISPITCYDESCQFFTDAPPKSCVGTTPSKYTSSFSIVPIRLIFIACKFRHGLQHYQVILFWFHVVIELEHAFLPNIVSLLVDQCISIIFLRSSCWTISKFILTYFAPDW